MNNSTNVSVNDLMIGNYVHCHDVVRGEVFDKIIQVSLIRSSYFFMHGVISGIEDENGIFHPEDSLHPICLTEEGLKGIGFKRCVEDKDDCLESCDKRIRMLSDPRMLNSNNKYYVHVDNQDYDSVATAEVSYLHELQQLLNLAGYYYPFSIDKVKNSF